MPAGDSDEFESRNSVITPVGVTRPIPAVPGSTNHRLPTGPAVFPSGRLTAVGTGYSVTVPLGMMRLILLPALVPVPASVNQTLPSGPAAMPDGALVRERSGGNSTTVPSCVTKP